MTAAQKRATETYSIIFSYASSLPAVGKMAFNTTLDLVIAHWSNIYCQALPNDANDVATEWQSPVIGPPSEHSEAASGTSAAGFQVATLGKLIAAGCKCRLGLGVATVPVAADAGLRRPGARSAACALDASSVSANEGVKVLGIASCGCASENRRCQLQVPRRSSVDLSASAGPARLGSCIARPISARDRTDCISVDSDSDAVRPGPGDESTSAAEIANASSSRDHHDLFNGYLGCRVPRRALDCVAHRLAEQEIATMVW